MPAILTNRRTNEKAHFWRLEALLKFGGRQKPDVVLNKVENCFLPHPVEWTKPMQTNLFDQFFIGNFFYWYSLLCFFIEYFWSGRGITKPVHLCGLSHHNVCGHWCPLSIFDWMKMSPKLQAGYSVKLLMLWNRLWIWSHLFQFVSFNFLPFVVNVLTVLSGVPTYYLY